MLTIFWDFFQKFNFFSSQLSEGSLEDNCVVDGSRITLLPKAETGLLVSFTFFYFNFVKFRARLLWIYIKH